MQDFLKELFSNQLYDEKNFFLIAGPCVVESEDVLSTVTEQVSSICRRLGIPFIFKSSYRKANRTSGSSFTGIGDDSAMKMLGNIRKTFSLPVVTDVHSPEEAEKAA